MALSGSDIDEAMSLAIQHHGAAQTVEAEAAYRRILLAQSDHANALNGLALLLWQAGRLDEGMVLAARAVQVAPQVWRYHYTHGSIALGMRRFELANAAFERACALNPEFADAQVGLARALLGAARFTDAVAVFERAQSLGSLSAATLNDYGVSLHACTRFGEAVTIYRLGLEQCADMAPLYTNLGNALSKLNLHDEADRALRKALDLDPGQAEYWFNHGNARSLQGAAREASVAFHHALNLNPQHLHAWVNLGNAQRATGDAAAAVDSYAHAIAIAPNHHDAHNNLGVALLSMSRVDEAIDAIHRALSLDPHSAVAYNNLGNAFKAARRMEEAIDAYRQATRLQPTDPQPHSNLLYSLYFHPDYDEASILCESQQWAQRHAAPFAAIAPVASSATPAAVPPRETKRALRIGYLSPDFREHCQSLFTLPLLLHHDHERFKIHCYAELSSPDATSARLAELADVWRPIKGLNDDQVAELIASDGIDILVDLTMHMAGGRPLVFARKPAPVQIAWLAYPGTTGQPAIDYRLTDPWLDPPESDDRRYVERSIRLPHTFWCYDPGESPPVVAPPVRSAGYITFGCLNNFCKVSDLSLELWVRVLAGVPLSRLLLLAPPGTHRTRILQKFAAASIASERVDFAPFQPRARYLATYGRIDICLDTLPYNGHTTSLDAFWMGVPVVTRVGDTIVGRAGWSQLNNLHLQDLAAFDDAGFIDTAIALASNRARLQELRHSLRGRMQASPLMDGKAFAAAMESIYLEAWQVHRAALLAKTAWHASTVS